MAIKTEQLHLICSDLVALLKQRVPQQNADLVELVGQQYFMGTLSRLISLSKHIETGGAPTSLKNLDLHFALSFPEEVNEVDVQAIRQEATVVLSECLQSLQQSLGN